MKKALSLFALIISVNTFAQRVYSLIPGIVVDSIIPAAANACKIAKDPITGNIFYATADGNVHEVFISANSKDSLRFTPSQHGIPAIQGLCFKDSTMYLCGNQWGSIGGIGMVVKGVLKPNHTRVWTNILTTVSYPTAGTNGDHGFSAVNVDPQKKYLFVSSGARTHLGEIRTNGGVYPGKREVPMTSIIFKIPIDTVGVVLQNDSTWLANSGFIFARGTRNAYDMAWDANGNLFAIDNSGERDDPEELNWLRFGKNYGFPWRMGGNYNPLMHSPYNVNNDPMVNHQSSGYQQGWFADDPTFPAIPNGVTFTDPVLNYGPDGDNYRDSVTGKVRDASNDGTFITSFTAHRSPLGLIIDKDSLLPSILKGDALLLSFMPGGDSTGYSPLSPWGIPCPFVDPVRDMLHLKLSYNSGINNFTMTATKIMYGFYLPVDAEQVHDTLYVIENGGNIWRIIFTQNIGVEKHKESKIDFLIYPNPASNSFTISSEQVMENSRVTITNVLGNEVMSYNLKAISNNWQMDVSNLQNGIYFVSVKNSKGSGTQKIIVQH